MGCEPCVCGLYLHRRPLCDPYRRSLHVTHTGNPYVIHMGDPYVIHSSAPERPLRDPYRQPLREPHERPLRDPYGQPLRGPYERPSRGPYGRPCVTHRSDLYMTHVHVARQSLVQTSFSKQAVCIRQEARFARVTSVYLYVRACVRMCVRACARGVCGRARMLLPLPLRLYSRK